MEFYSSGFGVLGLPGFQDVGVGLCCSGLRSLPEPTFLAFLTLSSGFKSFSVLTKAGVGLRVFLFALCREFQARHRLQNELRMNFGTQRVTFRALAS